MPSNGLLNEERRREILGILHQDGRVLVKDLARHFRISQITIRKDLEALDGQGVIQRTHGGALPVQAGALLDPTLREKEKLHRKQKAQIALAAARLVEEGQSVLLDSGTTTTAIARASVLWFTKSRASLRICIRRVATLSTRLSISKATNCERVCASSGRFLWSANNSA